MLILKGVSHVCHSRLPHAPGAAVTLLGLAGGGCWAWCALGLRLEKQNSRGWALQIYSTRLSIHKTQYTCQSTVQRNTHTQTLCTHWVCAMVHALIEASALTVDCHTILCDHTTQSSQTERKGKERKKVAQLIVHWTCNDEMEGCFTSVQALFGQDIHTSVTREYDSVLA